MSSSASPRGTSVRFGRGFLQAAMPILLGGLTATAILYIGLAFTDDPMGSGELGRMAGWPFVAAAVVGVLGRRDSVLLTEDALVVTNLRPRRIPWAAIHGMEVGRVLGVRQVTVCLVDGRRKALHVPMSFCDAEFDRKVRMLTEWWKERGPVTPEHDHGGTL